MDTEKTEGDVVDTKTNDGEGESEVETLTIPKKDYETLNQTLGSLKRELKDLKKPKEETKETPKNQPEDNTLLKKAFLRSAGITDSEEVELALSTAKKWSVEVDALVDDDDFKAKLEKHRTAKANTLATSNIKGGAGTSKAKESIEYWLNLGRTPKSDEVSDIKFRAKVLRAFADKEKGVGQGHFYNS